MAASEWILDLRHMVHQPFSISSECLIAVHIAVALSMEPRDG